MGISRVRAGELAAQLAGAGVKAHTDPGKAAGNLPCLLIGPPVLTPGTAGGGGYTATWSIFALASVSAGATAAWDDLDVLVDRVEEVLGVERAEPTSYTLPTGGDPLPAYRITHTEAIGG